MKMERVKEALRYLDRKRREIGSFRLEGNKKNSSSLCYILAGYKEYLWDNVFERIRLYAPQDMDICIVSSGLYSKKLSDYCKEQDWCYLYTKKNCLPLIQNIVIREFKAADWIYKIDEDIFITENFFEILKKTYEDAEKNSTYSVGYVAPLIPLNSYGTRRILEKLQLTDYYTDRFEKPYYGYNSKYEYYNNPDVALFFWGAGEKPFPTIDELNKRFQKQDFDYRICPITFNIGAILFRRDLWTSIREFNIKLRLGNCLGYDEEYLNSMCMIRSKVIVVSENAVVGHWAFTPQNETMKKSFMDGKVTVPFVFKSIHKED